MTERESFIASIREQPDADAPRLAFADYIEERGEHDHAELIRVQVERSRLNPRPRLLLEAFQPRFGELNGFVAVLARPFDALPQFPFVFDAISPNGRDVFACGCECHEIAQHDMRPRVRGTVTGIPCSVRPKADALDTKVAALMLRIPSGVFAPPDFDVSVSEDGYTCDEFSVPKVVFVLRGFVRHVYCHWNSWKQWCWWFRLNHPCERVTLTSVPMPQDLRAIQEPVGDPLGWDTPAVLAHEWPGTAFDFMLS